jgi:HSP90 family molecular chaperone
MKRGELEEYLSKLGTTIKQAENAGSTGNDPIGEFGIGFFSAFMIADRIIVRTRKPDEGKAFEWNSVGSTSYEITELQDPIEPGTQVTIILQPGSNRFADVAELRRIIQQYCDFMDCKVFLAGSPEPVNVGSFAWEVRGHAEQQRWVGRYFGEPPIAFTLGLASANEPVSFQFLLSCRNSGQPRHAIYSKRLFVIV